MTDEFDDQIRSQMRSREHPPANASAALESLKPAMRRARRRHQVAVGTMTVATLTLAGAGAAALGTMLRSPTTDGTVTLLDGPPPVTPAVEPVDTAVDDVDAPNADDSPLDLTIPIITIAPRVRVPNTSTAGEPTATQQVDDPLPTITTTPPRATTPPIEPPPTTPAPSPVVEPSTTVAATETTSAPTTSAPATSTTTPSATTTTTVAPSSGQMLISSDCGTVTVAYDVFTVTLVATEPGPGFAIDVKSSGPENVEVGFAGGDLECQIHAEMGGGQLVVDVENPGD